MNEAEISEQLRRVEQRLQDLEFRLARLEAKDRPLAPPPPRPPEPDRVPVAAPSPEAAAPSFGLPPARRPRINVEAAFGVAWISRIAALTVVLALAFFFEYAFQNHWITASGRVLLGIVAAAAALATGERSWRHDQRVFGQALTASGIAFLYLSVWAAFALYGLISRPVAFALMVMVTAAAGALANRYHGAAIALLGLAGGFATPLLLKSSGNAWFVLAYVLLLDLAAASGARLRSWKMLEPLALAGTLILYVDLSQPIDSRVAFTAFVAAAYALFAASLQPAIQAAAQVMAPMAAVQIWSPGAAALWPGWTVAAAGLAVADRRGWRPAVPAAFAGFWLAYLFWPSAPANEPPSSAALAPLTAAFLIFLAYPVWMAMKRDRAPRFAELVVMALNAGLFLEAGYSVLHLAHRGLIGLFAVAAASLQMAAARLLWQRDRRAALLAAGAAWLLLVLAVPIQFDGYRATIAWALEGAALAWIGCRFRNDRAVTGALAIFFLVVLRLGVADSGMYGSPWDYSPLANARFFTFTAAAGALGAAAWWIRRDWRALVCYLAGHLVMLWGLSLETAGWVARTTSLENLPSATSMSLSVLAAAYAVLLVAVGAARKNGPTRMLGAALIGLVVIKLYLYDVWLLSQFYRMTAFAILGFLLLVISYLYSRFRGSLENWWHK